MSVRYRNGKGLFIDYPSEAIIDEETGKRYYDGIKPNYVSSKEVCKLLNNLTNDNKQLKQQVEIYKEDGLKTLDDLQRAEENNRKGLSNIEKLTDENEQLKQRNENQYQQLNELWGIIEEENWEKLIAMKKQLKEDEERLQREWKCYE